MFLGAVGNVKEVEKYLDFSNDENLAREIQGKSFSTWKTQVSHTHTHTHTRRKLQVGSAGETVADPIPLVICIYH